MKKVKTLLCLLPPLFLALSLAGCQPQEPLETERLAAVCTGWAEALPSRDGDARRALMTESLRADYDDEVLFGWLDASGGLTLRGYDYRLEDVGTLQNGESYCYLDIVYSLRGSDKRDYTAENRLILHRTDGEWRIFETSGDHISEAGEAAPQLFDQQAAGELLLRCLGVDLAAYEGRDGEWFLLSVPAGDGDDFFAVSGRTGELCAVIDGERCPLSRSPLCPKGAEKAFSGRYYLFGSDTPCELRRTESDRFACSPGGAEGAQTDVFGRVKGCQGWTDDGGSLYVWNADGQSVSRYSFGENGLLAQPVFLLPAHLA